MKNPTLYNHNAVREAQLEQNLDARINAPAAEPLQAPALPAHLRVRTLQELLPISAASDDELIRRLEILADADPEGTCSDVVALFDEIEREFLSRHPEGAKAVREARIRRQIESARNDSAVGRALSRLPVSGAVRSHFSPKRRG